jgi:hypothetical protein
MIEVLGQEPLIEITGDDLVRSRGTSEIATRSCQIERGRLLIQPATTSIY